MPEYRVLDLRGTWPRAIYALGLASAFALILATRGIGHFEGYRLKVVTTAVRPSADRVDIPAGRDASRLPPHVALIARIRNDTDASRMFRIEVDGRPLCAAQIAAGVERRVDCVLTRPEPPGASPPIAVVASPGAWSLEYLELATHFGRSSEPVALYILPGTAPYAPPDAGWIGGLWLLTMLVFLIRPVAARRRTTRAAYNAAAAVATTALVLIAVTPWVSMYRIVVTPATVSLFAVLVAAPQLVQAGRWVAGHVAWTAAYTRILVAALVALAFSQVILAHLRESQGNHSALIQLDEAAVSNNPLLKERGDIRSTLVVRDGGYDGQFMYFAIFDPFLRAFHDEPRTYRAVMDAPPYRFGRIGFSWLVKVVSVDRWRWYPAVMVWLPVVSVFVMAVVAGALAVRAGAAAWWGVLVALVPGFWVSIQTALPEPLAAALLVGGYYCTTRGRWITAAAFLGASLLVRETGLVFVLWLLVWEMRKGFKRSVILAGLLALAPVCVWRAYVGMVLYPDWGWQAFFFDPEDLTLPFAGFVELWQTVQRGEYHSALAESAVWFPLLLSAALALAAWLAFRTPSALTWAALTYALIAVSLNYRMIWVHVGNGQRGTYEVFVLLLLCTLTKAFSPGTQRVLFVFWAAAAAYVFVGASDATFIRSAIIPGM